MINATASTLLAFSVTMLVAASVVNRRRGQPSGGFVSAVVLAGLRRSIWAGVRVAVWAVLLASVAVFAVAVSESVLWYQDDSSLILAGDGVPITAVGENIGDFTFLMVMLPYLWTPFGVISAAIGAAGRAHHRVRAEVVPATRSG